MVTTIEVLDPSGHLLLTWDATIPESVERARAEFSALVAAGYQFFRVEGGTPEPSFSSEAGALTVKRVEPAEIAPTAAPADAPPPARRHGRPPAPDRIVATRPMRGG